MRKTIVSLIKTCAPFALLAAIMCGVHLAGLGHIFNEAWIDANIRDHGAYGYGIFLLLATVLTSLPFPRQIICFLAGYAFGAGMGTVWALLGTMLGCMLTFTWARLLGQGYILRRHGHRIQKVNAFLAQNPFTMALMIRCMPTGSNFLVNITAGVSRIPAKPFFAGSFIGYIPQTLVFSLLGSGLTMDPAWRTSLSVALFLLSTLLFGMLCRRYKLSLKTETNA